MKCRHCHARWHGESEKIAEICPNCGFVLKDGKEPFHMVWASIEEDNLKRKPNQAAFDKTASHYLQAVQDNPATLNRLMQFLASWPQYSEKSAILQPLFSQASYGQDADIPFEEGILLDFAAKGIQPAMTMAFHTYSQLLESQEEVDQQKRHTYEKALLKAAEAMDDQSAPLKRAVQAAVLHNWQDSVRYLKEALLEDPEDGLEISDELAIQYAGLNQNARERIDEIRSRMRQPDTDQQAARITELLVRPLLTVNGSKDDEAESLKQNERNAFDHLPLLDEPILQWIFQNWQAVKKEFNEYIANRMCLRGVHLALSEIKSRVPELETECSALLDDHFAEVFMQDYETIERTDRIW